MKTLADIGIIPEANIASLTPVVEQELLAIPTTEVDDVERKVTIRIDGNWRHHAGDAAGRNGTGRSGRPSR